MCKIRLSDGSVPIQPHKTPLVLVLIHFSVAT